VADQLQSDPGGDESRHHHKGESNQRLARLSERLFDGDESHSPLARIPVAEALHRALASRSRTVAVILPGRRIAVNAIAGPKPTVQRTGAPDRSGSKPDRCAPPV
jgi:hypothetical protein